MPFTVKYETVWNESFQQKYKKKHQPNNSDGILDSVFFLCAFSETFAGLQQRSFTIEVQTVNFSASSTHYACLKFKWMQVYKSDEKVENNRQEVQKSHEQFPVFHFWFAIASSLYDGTMRESIWTLSAYTHVYNKWYAGNAVGKFILISNNFHKMLNNNAIDSLYDVQCTQNLTVPPISVVSILYRWSLTTTIR